MFYIEKENEIKLADASRQKLENTISFMPDYKDLEIKESEVDIALFENKYYFVDDPEYIEKKAIADRQKLDLMTLTPADVERALYKAKGMDFEDLKEFILSSGTGIDPKALAIEFRAKDFYRGAMFGNGRLFDIVGGLLGYTSEDIDYLFENKELPEGD